MPFTDRMEYLEQFMGDSLGKHEKERFSLCFLLQEAAPSRYDHVRAKPSEKSCSKAPRHDHLHSKKHLPVSSILASCNKWLAFLPPH